MLKENEGAFKQWELSGKPWWPLVEPSDRRVRVEAGGRVIAASRSPLLLIDYGPGPDFLPRNFLTWDEVDSDALVNPHDDPGRNLRLWDVETSAGVISDAAAEYLDVPADRTELDGRVYFRMGKVDQYEEDQLLIAHAKDPHKRVDALPSSRHIQVRIEGELVADSTSPVALFETMAPTRYYLPAADVRIDLLEPSATTSVCPYKGFASYWSFRTPAGVADDIAWRYADPVAENPRIKGLVCFRNERVDTYVDGELEPRPITPWS